MTRNYAFLLALALLLAPGCRGTLTLFGVEPTGDDDDATGDDDDATSDDDDATSDDDDDDATGDDDDATEPPGGVCVPDWPLDCGEGATDQYGNGNDGSTNSVLEYSCLQGEQWTGPEYTYSFVAETSGSHTLTVYDFDEDLDLFALASPGGECEGGNCIGYSGNPPGTPEELVIDLDAGQLVYFVIDGYDGSVSDYQLRLECPSSGDDDDDDDDDDGAPACTDPVLSRPHQANNALTWTYTNGAYTAGPDLNPSGSGTVWGAVSGDFDDDGAMDVITEREGDQGFSTALFSGDCNTGTFTEVAVSGFTYAGFDDLHGVADVDQDGDLDVLGIEFNDGDGRVWLNDGTGTSWTAVGDAFELDSWDPSDTNTFASVGLPAVDVTGDQLPDLLECNNNAQSPTSCVIHNGVGDGTFVEGATFTLQRLANSVAAGDFNGDGAIDYVGGLDDDGDAGQVWMWEGIPGGPSTLPSGGGVEAFDVEPDGAGSDTNEPGYGWLFPGDADDDGDLDVFVTVMDPFGGANHVVYLATNDGLGGFTVSTIGSSDNSWGDGGDNARVQSSLGVPVRP